MTAVSLALTATHPLIPIRTPEGRTRSIRTTAESVSLSDKFFTLALLAKLRAEHLPAVDKSVRSRKGFESLADKRFPRSSSRCRLTTVEPLTKFDPESRRLVIFLSLPRQNQPECAH